MESAKFVKMDFIRIKMEIVKCVLQPVKSVTLMVHVQIALLDNILMLITNVLYVIRSAKDALLTDHAWIVLMQTLETINQENVNQKILIVLNFIPMILDVENVMRVIILIYSITANNVMNLVWVAIEMVHAKIALEVSFWTITKNVDDVIRTVMDVIWMELVKIATKATIRTIKDSVQNVPILVVYFAYHKINVKFVLKITFLIFTVNAKDVNYHIVRNVQKMGFA